MSPASTRPPHHGLTPRTPVGRYEHREPRNDSRELRDEPPGVIGDHHFEETYGESTSDYDNGATVLYELLESSNWEKARSRCRSHPEEVRTWIVRKDRSLQVRWKLLPLHAAIIFQSPNFMVSALLEKYPAAASRKDDQGMLPLHLAFRHKQEDEDLLELLLVQYSKAVMVKDRRERVPLEHGRDSKFSAKLMRLYADATVAGSRTMSGLGNTSKLEHSPTTTRTTVGSSLQLNSLQLNSLHEHQIARVEAEHEGKIAILKADLKADNEGKLALLKAEFEDELQRLKDAHDGRMLKLVEENRKAIDEGRSEAFNERQRLNEQHKEEMNELRDLLTSQVRKDRMMRDALENEVSGLHSDLNETRQDAEYEQSKFNRMKAHVTDIHQLLSTLCEDHVLLQDMVQHQQEEIDSAKATRQELLNTLMENENNDGDNCQMRTAKMTEITSKLQDKVERTLERSDEWSDNPSPSKEGPSRIERERGEEGDGDDDISIFSAEKTQDPSGRDGPYRMEEARDITRSEAYHVEEVREVIGTEPFPVVEGRELSREEEYLVEQQVRDMEAYKLEQSREVALEPAYHVEEGIEITSEGITEDVYTPTTPPKDDHKGYEGRILADDISAITDNSEF
jgi:hypothetical protein